MLIMLCVLVKLVLSELFIKPCVKTNLANGQTHSKYPSAVAVGLAFKGLKSLLPFVIYMGYHTIYIDFVNYIYRYSTIQYHSDTCW